MLMERKVEFLLHYGLKTSHPQHQNFIFINLIHVCIFMLFTFLTINNASLASKYIPTQDLTCNFGVW